MILLLITNSMPLKVAGQRDLALYFPPFTLFSVSDIHFLEANIYFRRTLINNPEAKFATPSFFGYREFHPELDFNLIDPFTGKPYLVKGDVQYSIGPDMIDNGGMIIYDPTNGTFSSGDMSPLNFLLSLRLIN